MPLLNASAIELTTPGTHSTTKRVLKWICRRARRRSKVYMRGSTQRERVKPSTHARLSECTIKWAPAASHPHDANANATPPPSQCAVEEDSRSSADHSPLMYSRRWGCHAPNPIPLASVHTCTRGTADAVGKNDIVPFVRRKASSHHCKSSRTPTVSCRICVSAATVTLPDGDAATSYTPLSYNDRKKTFP